MLPITELILPVAKNCAKQQSCFRDLWEKDIGDSRGKLLDIKTQKHETQPSMTTCNHENISWTRATMNNNNKDDSYGQFDDATDGGQFDDAPDCPNVFGGVAVPQYSAIAFPAPCLETRQFNAPCLETRQGLGLVPIQHERTLTAKPFLKKPQRRSSPKSCAAPKISEREISSDDVLCGRGGGTNKHAGNKYFRSLVNHVRPQYILAEKLHKSTIANAIVAAVQARGGRFLKKDQSTAHQWVVITAKQAILKTSQALREGMAKQKRDALRESMGKCKADQFSYQHVHKEQHLSTVAAAACDAPFMQQNNIWR
mmetsp:Transcript_29417/g.42681  ORF Transcript_29417/g.42681 Transcript_29417/m.42681 type:complete len:312 (+) Transcript_29417:20-955(+)